MMNTVIECGQIRLKFTTFNIIHDVNNYYLYFINGIHNTVNSRPPFYRSLGYFIHVSFPHNILNIIYKIRSVSTDLVSFVTIDKALVIIQSFWYTLKNTWSFLPSSQPGRQGNDRSEILG